MLIRFFIFFLLASLTFAQEFSFVGSVVSDGKPLKGVNVFLKESNIGTITSNDGQFVINSYIGNSQKLIFSFVGYKPVVKIISPSNLDIGIIELLPDETLEEVVVSSTLKPVSKLDSPTPVEVYSQSFFKANPTASIFESLGNINGIRPQLNCNICNTGDIHINGQEGSYTMVLIDGFPIVSGLSTVYGLSGIPRSLIDRVEVVKGPASTLYGSEAIGGLINLITRLPENTDTISLDSFVSGWGEINTDIGYKYNLSNNNFGLLGINYFNYSNPIDNNQDGFTDLTVQDRISIFNKLSFGNKFSLATRYIYEDRWGGQMNWTKADRGKDQIYGESIYTSRFEIFGNYLINKNLSLYFSFNDHYQNSVYGLNFFNANQTVGFGQFIWTNSFKKHNLLVGLAYRYTYYDDDTTATYNEKLFSNLPSNIHLPGIFFQDELKFNEYQSLLFGLRYDYNSLHGDIVTPRINYKLNNVDKSTILRLSFGSGYRVAQIFTEDHAALTGARDVVFLEELNPERSWNLNANVLKKLYFKQGALLDIDFSIFYTKFSNKIIPKYDLDPTKIIYSNLIGTSTNQGASLNLNLLIQNGIRLNLGTTFIDSFIKEENFKSTPFLTERYQGVLKIEKKWINSGIILDITSNTTGPLKLPILGDFDPRPSFSKTFHIINAQLTKSWNNVFESYGGLKNLLNFLPPENSIARPFDPFDRLVVFDDTGNVVPTQNNPYSLTFDPSYVYASNQGVRFFLGLRWKYN